MASALELELVAGDVSEDRLELADALGLGDGLALLIAEEEIAEAEPIDEETVDVGVEGLRILVEEGNAELIGEGAVIWDGALENSREKGELLLKRG